MEPDSQLDMRRWHLYATHYSTHSLPDGPPIRQRPDKRNNLWPR